MTDPRKLKAKEIKPTRLAMLEAQGFICAICKLPCNEDQAVLDHAHNEIGYVRAVLHRGCNAAEGKILNTLRRYGIKDQHHFLRELITYHEFHSTNRTGLIHCTHKTEEEKKELAKKRAKRKRVKAKKAP